jgi:hypothetical protein
VVQFQSPIQPTDRVVLEYLVNNSWIESQVSNQPYINTSGLDYGAQVQPVSGTTNQVQVSFAQYRVGPSGTNWGTSTGALAWNGVVSQGAAWRVRKTSAGAAVGFGIVQPGVSSGLVSASGLPGRTDGGVVPAGYVGEERVMRGILSVTAGSYNTTPGLLVTKGVWIISLQAVFPSATGMTYVVAGISAVSTASSFPDADNTLINISQMSASGASYDPSPTVTYYLNLAADTTYYAKLYSNGANSSARYVLRAVRIA